ncbi:MAG: Mrp/NBP35 family ATP-binding protein [bacterium]|nr:Mrp/NBP35 family ATP-binding protein [bacterium]
MITPDNILSALRSVIDPDLKKDLVTLNMIRDLSVTEDGAVSLRLVLTTPACPFRGALEDAVRAAILSVDNTLSIHMTTDANVPELPAIFRRTAIPGVRNIVAVVSGKGGVGKSTVSVNIASALAQTGARVGLLDADIYGPSIPLLMSANDVKIELDPEADITPIRRHDIQLVSFGFIAKKDDAVIWRGPLASKALRQLLQQTRWGELDYLIVDMPPGTGDLHLTLLQAAPLSGGVIVTTPQGVALADATRAMAMFKKLGAPVLGVVENMSGAIFGQGGGESFSQTHGTAFLGSIPLDAIVRQSGDNGMPLPLHAPDHAISKTFSTIAQRLAQEISKAAFTSI